MRNIFLTVMLLLFVWVGIVPVQAENTMKFYKHYENHQIKDENGNNLLADKIIKRVVPSKSGKYIYILAHDESKKGDLSSDDGSYLYAYNLADKKCTELKSVLTTKRTYKSTTDGTASAGDEYLIGNIDVTYDGYLVACTQSKVALYSESIYLQYWNWEQLGGSASNTESIKFNQFNNNSETDQRYAVNDKPLPAINSSNTDCYHFHGNYSDNRCGESFAWQGNLKEGFAFYTSSYLNKSGVRWVSVGVPSGKGYYNKFATDKEEPSVGFITSWPTSNGKSREYFLWKTASSFVGYLMSDTQGAAISSSTVTSNDFPTSSNHTPIFVHWKNNTTETAERVEGDKYIVSLNSTNNGFALARVNYDENYTFTSVNTNELTTTTALTDAVAAGCSDEAGNLCVFLVSPQNGITKFSTEPNAKIEANPAEVVLLPSESIDVTITGAELTQAITWTPTEDITVVVKEGGSEDGLAATGGVLTLTAKDEIASTTTGKITLTSGNVSCEMLYTLTKGELQTPVLQNGGAYLEGETKKAVFTWKPILGATHYDVQEYADGAWKDLETITKPEEAKLIYDLDDESLSLTLRIRARIERDGETLAKSDWSNSVKVMYSSEKGFNLYTNYAGVEIKDENGTNLLAGKTIKRVVPANDGVHLYILAHHKDNDNWVPTLVCYNHKTQAAYLISVEGLKETSNNTIYKPLSDIDVSDDDYIVGVSEELVKDNGNPIHVYKWKPTDKVVAKGTILEHWFKTTKNANYTEQINGEAIAYYGKVDVLSDPNDDGTQTSGQWIEGKDDAWLFYTVESQDKSQDNNYHYYVRFRRIYMQPSKEGGAYTNASTYYNTMSGTADGSRGLFLDTYGKLGHGGDGFIMNETDKPTSQKITNALNQYTKFVNANTNNTLTVISPSTTLADLYAGMRHTPVFSYQGKDYMVGATNNGLKVADVTTWASATEVTLTSLTDGTTISTTSLGDVMNSNGQDVIVAAGTAFDEHHLGLFVVNGTNGTITKYSTVNDRTYDCVFTGSEETGYQWSTEANWSTGALPDATSKVLINSNCEIAAGQAYAEKIDVVTDKKLTIAPTAALTVQQTIQQVESETNTTPQTLAKEQLLIKADATGQGTLAYFGTQAEVNATVQLYGLYQNDSETPQWQYITPSCTVHELMGTDFYGSWVKQWNAGANAWEYLTGYGKQLNPWQGYLLLSGTKGTIYTMQGALQKNTIHTVNLMEATEYKSRSRLVGNSWTAPLNIASFNKDTDFKNVEATIYLYSYQGAESGYTSDIKGCYHAITVNNAENVYSPAVINPLQGFFVMVNKGETSEASLTLNYEQLVENNEQPTHNTLRVQQRQAEEQNVSSLSVTVTADDGYHAKVFLFEDERYTEGYDNGSDAYKLRDTQGIPYLAAASTAGNMAILATPSISGTYLNFEKGSGTEHTFTFTYDGTDELWLEDLVEQTETQVYTGNTYTFTATADDSYRFRLVSEVQAPNLPSEAPQVWVNDDRLYLTNPAGIRTEVGIYSVGGQLVERIITYDTMQTLNLPTTGVYVIQVRNEYGVQTIKHIL